MHRSVLVLALAALTACGGGGRRIDPNAAEAVGDTPTIAAHVSHAALAAGEMSIADAVEAGGAMFSANFNTLDGAGRPESTGTGAPRARREGNQAINRISGGDAGSCAGCHNLPRAGGGGDNVANVFVLSQAFPHLNFDGGEGDNFQANLELRDTGNERNTLGMFGAGYIELLAREITAALHAQRDQALADAAAMNMPINVNLTAKGIDYGTLVAMPNGTLDTSAVDGIDADLIIKPFHQKGVVISLREFTNNATNHHHGMQSSERFGPGVDADGDGMADELSEGDITAMTLWQALLPPPGQVIPADPGSPAHTAIANGEQLFTTIGCASCHVPEIVLDDPVFTEPSPYNPAGNLTPATASGVVSVDLTTNGDGPRLPRRNDGKVVVRAFTDFKRHDMGAALNNERVVQAGVPTNEFLTKKLWGGANEPPYMHHGRALTLSDAILMHGGDAQTQRDAFAALPQNQKDEIIAFLKTLQVLPEDATTLTMTAPHSGIIGDEPAIVSHVDQTQINNGVFSAQTLFDFGAVLFSASFNPLDGAGRPETTGTGSPRARYEDFDSFNRISGPDANSCAGCHNIGGAGGGGDNVANVFVLAQRLPCVDFSDGAGDGFMAHTLENVGNERNTLGMWGSGFIELLAREMTTEMHAIRAQAITDAMNGGNPVTVSLDTKGVNFGSITAMPNGTVDTTAVEGVDADLIIKPFHQKGAVISLREFSNNAMNHHHGIQSSERFGPGADPDNDGMVDELTEGDITAVTLWQAMLRVPSRVYPSDPKRRAAVDMGETLFSTVGCAECHKPFLVLDDPVFTEPNPYNPAGNLQVNQVPQPFAVDLTQEGPAPRLTRESNGKVLVPAFTDLKRHNMGPALDNEQLVQGGIPTEMWLTRKLWGFANEPPFLHHGRASTIAEAISMHGGDAQAAYDAYMALSATEQNAIIDFLKTMQVLPKGSPLVTEN